MSSQIWAGEHWVVEVDIRSYFDTVDHELRRLAVTNPTWLVAGRRASPVDSTSFRTCHDPYTGECSARSKFPRSTDGFAKPTEARHSHLIAFDAAVFA